MIEKSSSMCSQWRGIFHEFPTSRASFIGLILVFITVTVSGQPDRLSSKAWTWTDQNGVTRSRAELEKIIKDNELWFKSNADQGRFGYLGHANLSDANLVGWDLSGADMVGAILVRANLVGAKLNRVRLDYANLSGAVLDDADIVGAHLENANLSGAHISGKANLSDANLNGADLSGSNLMGADLTRARLQGVDLSQANLFHADLRGVCFECKTNPSSEEIAYGANIELLTYKVSPSALLKLRKQFEDDGFRDAERKITYALKRRETVDEGAVERWFNTIAFDWTSQYGMSPGRALFIWLYLFLVCSIIYGAFIHSTGESGLYRVQHGPQNTIEERLSPRPIPPGPRLRFAIAVMGREARVAGYALYFSLIIAFSLGVWDIKFGKWLRQFPKTEYDLKPIGWLRPVAAAQAALSVGLLVLWVLTYFGRPFN